ncbi:hypothetical protein [Marinoscillum sp.]|uniref:hypothetical protein n=1 Tax=Marinoscillum sp. TaxID=2024838 RepID=UPI003BAB7F63
MEINLTSSLSEWYVGNIVYNGSKSIINTEVAISALNNILIKVHFKLGERQYSFRAVLSEQEEGILMLIQDRTIKGYMLQGVSGFLHSKPNVHGGYITRLNALYFHIKLSHYDGVDEEIYFLGKNREEYERMKKIRSQSLLESV